MTTTFKPGQRVTVKPEHQGPYTGRNWKVLQAEGDLLRIISKSTLRGGVKCQTIRFITSDMIEAR